MLIILYTKPGLMNRKPKSLTLLPLKSLMLSFLVVRN
nr:MAG TPA: hypothetical protein [Caudoviricetes sp.]DAT16627.1 MAG TPA: hypothetical protein [Caudoviricetes sp.]DAW73527.1 MAG TPA: hypothetical protein [Caudoviricetes sp.]DAX26119.1 MAG TPA: hypothetical protein [Caudoviricetes sp.]